MVSLAHCFLGRLFDGLQGPVARQLPALLADLEALRSCRPRIRGHQQELSHSSPLGAIARLTLRLLFARATQLASPLERQEEELFLAMPRFAFEAVSRSLDAYITWLHSNAIPPAPSDRSGMLPVSTVSHL